MEELTQLDNIERIVYMWARYAGIRTPKGKEYSGNDISNLIGKLTLYKDFPEKFDYALGEVPEEE